MTPRLVILGTAAVGPDVDHENTHMALEGTNGVYLIDCVGLPLARLKHAGIDHEKLRGIILTHFHPDHVAAVPGLLLSLWIMGRTDPLHIYGLSHCLNRVEQMMGFYHWEKWNGFFPVVFHHLPPREGVQLLDTTDFTIYASPVRHYVPTIGVRVVVKQTDYIMAYSGDTIPCPETVRLAYNADLLIHEATGDEPLGHSSAAQAGAIAKEARAKRLGLIHYPVWNARTAHLVDEARATFGERVFLCEDMMSIPLG
ncbi:MAG: MBL fold metallo-hydrolase [Chloroflexi bacterium]|nr:MBL fold metallo-hydrolase [Chloroflexota bacterium]